MPLNKKQLDYVAELNSDGKRLFKSGGDKAILKSLPSRMDKIKELIDNGTKGELDMYCQRYEGFYHYMKMLEKLAIGCKNGAFDDITY